MMKKVIISCIALVMVTLSSHAQLKTESVAIDTAAINNSSVTPGLLFGGIYSGEGISSNRVTSGANKNGLDFYCNHTRRMSLTNAGGLGIAGVPTASQMMFIDADRPTTTTTKGIQITTSSLDNAYGLFLLSGTSSAGSNLNTYGLYSEIKDNSTKDRFGSETNYGVYSNVNADDHAVYNTGVYGFADGASNYNYSIFGEEGAHGNTWAGYFLGKVQVIGNIYGDSVFAKNGGFNYVMLTSDRNMKKDITRLSSASELLNAVQAYTYEFKTEEYPQLGLPSGIHYGMISQEIQEQFPSLVEKRISPAVRDKKGNVVSEEVEVLSLNYIEFIPMLIEAHKEQEATISELNDEISQMHSELEDLKEAKNGGNLGQNSLNSNAKGSLFANFPNPTSEMTTITFELTGASSASIEIYDMNGVPVRSFPVETNSSSLNIDVSQMAGGMYIYMLKVDGQQVDSKSMVVVQ